MNKIALLVLISCFIVVVGCHKNGTDSGTPPLPQTWSAKHRWTRGNRPVPSPGSRDILFGQEESPAGLYLLHDSTATLLNPTGPAIQPDYEWSNDGMLCCFSSPGSPGEGATGIYYGSVTAGTAFQKLWDRGSHPRFLPGDQYIVCAGPEDGSDSAGIWQIKLSDQSRTRLLQEGVEPEVSPDGQKIAFLITHTAWNARTLVVYHRFTFIRDTIGNLVLHYAWLGDSQSIVYHTTSDAAPALYITRIGGTSPGDSLRLNGTYPSGFRSNNEFIYTGISADTVSGIFLSNGLTTPEQLFSSGTMAMVGNDHWIVIQSRDGIWELTR